MIYSSEKLIPHVLSTGKKMGYKELAEGWLAKKEKEFGSLLTTANEAVKIAPTQRLSS